MFHEEGDDVVIENGVAIPFREAIMRLKNELKAVEDRLANETDERYKRPIQIEIHEVEEKIEKLDSKKRKLIHNGGSITFHADTPQGEILTHTMSILSQDTYESEYRFVEASGKKLITRVNILRGFSSVILCQAIDVSDHPRADEISRRLIHVNPEMSSKKYGAAYGNSREKIRNAESCF